MSKLWAYPNEYTFLPHGDGRAYFVYALLCPWTGHPKYIGCTTTPRRRASKHMSESGNREKLEWVRGLKRLEKRPLFQILDVVDEARSVARETFWIAFCAVNGFPLFNKSLPIAVKTYVWPRKRVRGWIPSD